MSADQKTFNALGKEWVARFDFNAICDLEERTDRAFLEMVAPLLNGLSPEDRDDPAKAIAAASTIKLSDLRLILWQSLQGNQPGTPIATVGDIIAEIGIGDAMALVSWAVIKAIPANDPEGNGKPKR